MFSGKSTELISRVRKHKLLGEDILVVNHSSDKRYMGTGYVVSHDKDSVGATSSTSVRDIINMPEFEKCAHVFIDEGQFFHDLYDGVWELVEKHNKNVTICALDGTWERKPFMQVVQLIPYAEEVVKLTALCYVCKNGNHASFSKRIINNTDTECVGGIESYIPVCRLHF